MRQEPLQKYAPLLTHARQHVFVHLRAFGNESNKATIVRKFEFNEF